MFNVGKPLRTPDDILIEVEDEEPDSKREDEDPQIEVEGGMGDFTDQDDILKTLGMSEIEEHEDGSVTVHDGEGEQPAEASGDFNENLALTIPDADLGVIALECIQAFDEDVTSRMEWEESLARGLKLLGMAVEERNDPWEKACGVFHPVLLEAVIRGWAKSVRDLAPARGPAKTELKSLKKGATKRLKRTAQEINCTILNDVPGYAEEQSRMSFMMHLSGAGFKKVYRNDAVNKIESRYVHPQDLIMPYGTTDIDMCPRICHRQYLFPSEVNQMIDAGLWKKVPMGAPAVTQKSEVSEKLDDVSGVRQASKPTQREILEFHIDIELQADTMAPEGRAMPYLIVIDKSTQQVLNIRRNWKEETQVRRKYFVAYQYVTGYSVYGIGMVHLIGGLAEGGTSILRQLVDAGTLSNLPAGFKVRGFRVRNDDKPLKPGEWRDVDFTGNRLEDAIMPLPFKEPSLVLSALLEKLVEEARRTSSVIDAAVSDIGKEAPVGSVLAILEESLVIQNSVKIGMLRSLGKELSLITELMLENKTKYEYLDEDDEADLVADFASPLRVIPAADPNASSMAQKVVAYREAINTAQAAPPNTYDMKELHRSFLEAMEIQNAEKIVPLEEDIEPFDPVTENMRILRLDPIKVFDHQNHEAHLQIHLNAMNDPMIQQMIGQGPQAAQIQAALAAHVNEHVAYAYRARIEQFYGQALPDPEKPLPIEVERALAPELAKASQQVVEQSRQQVAQQKAQELAADPVIQIKQREVAIKENEQERKAIESFANLEQQANEAEMDATIRLLELVNTVDTDKKKMIMDAMLQMKNMRVNVALEKMRAKQNALAQQRSSKKGK